MSNRAHARLNASGSHIWMVCPQAVQGVDDLPDTQTIHQAEGTAAHMLAETCARTGKFARDMLGETITVGQFEFEVDDEMVDCVNTYLTEIEPYMNGEWEFEIESRVQLDHFYPGMFGTADFLAYHPETKNLVVIDYKHGKGKTVEVKENSQLLYYAAGAVMRYHNRGIGDITMRIVQPRRYHAQGPVRSETVDSVTLLEWTADLVDAAKRTEDEDADYVVGDHCTFCKKAAICTALQQFALDAAKAEFTEAGEMTVSDPTTYDPQQISEAWFQGNIIETWLHRVRELAHHEAEAGRVPPGLKLVAKRAVRRWISEEDAKQFLLLYGLDEKDIMSAPEFLSPAQIDKVLKKDKDVTKDLWVKRSSGNVLAPLDDERPAVTSNAAEDFAEPETSVEDMLG